jgi:hypothetical protein
MYPVLLFLHFIGLALAMGTGFAFMRLGPVIGSLPPPERVPLFLRLSVLGKNSSIGLALLIASGLGMATLRGFGATFAWGGGAFHAKLALVVLISGVFGYQQVVIKRVREQGGGPGMALIPKLGSVMLVLGLGIVAAAVAAFQ